ncbi:uncharacterized protein MELLADRAFT_114359 [Melampsora larici-populina 98AG31]|uniref:Uncharacterized protein n=1 Tax=Melampsora larici-populina (strain 98AG31 / pathotype 3-4-7) TaxID=747676 RepID=F4SD62_MELLP|nr:uncharacterized protein MELLADRAFT_114359 [Melampsora larici-populina 98AG31]EGF97415.1 hypothetical protein MELLADRAFT_114359 [Melampsora larici-populina 98AG31]
MGSQSSQLSTSSNPKIKIKVSLVPDFDSVTSEDNYDLCDGPLEDLDVLDTEVLKDISIAMVTQMAFISFYCKVEPEDKEPVETRKAKPKGQKNPPKKLLDPIEA